MIDIYNTSNYQNLSINDEYYFSKNYFDSPDKNKDSQSNHMINTFSGGTVSRETVGGSNSRTPDLNFPSRHHLISNIQNDFIHQLFDHNLTNGLASRQEWHLLLPLEDTNTIQYTNAIKVLNKYNVNSIFRDILNYIFLNFKLPEFTDKLFLNHVLTTHGKLQLSCDMATEVLTFCAKVANRNGEYNYASFLKKGAQIFARDIVIMHVLFKAINAPSQRNQKIKLNRKRTSLKLQDTDTKKYYAVNNTYFEYDENIKIKTKTKHVIDNFDAVITALESTQTSLESSYEIFKDYPKYLSSKSKCRINFLGNIPYMWQLGSKCQEIYLTDISYLEYPQYSDLKKECEKILKSPYGSDMFNFQMEEARKYNLFFNLYNSSLLPLNKYPKSPWDTSNKSIKKTLGQFLNENKKHSDTMIIFNETNPEEDENFNISSVKEMDIDNKEDDDNDIEMTDNNNNNNNNEREKEESKQKDDYLNCIKTIGQYDMESGKEILKRKLLLLHGQFISFQYSYLNNTTKHIQLVHFQKLLNLETEEGKNNNKNKKKNSKHKNKTFETLLKTA